MTRNRPNPRPCVQPPSETLFPHRGHNHRICLEQAIGRAKTVCAERGIKLTELRQRIFQEIASSHKPLGAYDIIERLAGSGRRLAPISVYRIIEVLEGAGLVHRLESRNAYFACLSEHSGKTSSIVLLCEACGRVAEAEAPQAWDAITAITETSNFRVAETVLEIKGRCAECAA